VRRSPAHFDQNPALAVPGLSSGLTTMNANQTWALCQA
jgi:hypothetical protein